MLNVSRQPSVRVRCRQIEHDDLDAIVALLTKGFVDRTEDYWRRGLARHASRPQPPDCPLYGYMLESDGRPVGVLLTLHSVIEEQGVSSLRCNLSSWYVEPPFRAQAMMLDKAAQRQPSVTYLNVSPAPHTFALQEARGFQRYCKGQVFSVPALSRVPKDLSARLVTADDPLDDLSLRERTLLRDHADYGCVCIVVTQAEKSEPVIFLKRHIGPFKRTIGGGVVPCFQLVYCRDTADLPRFAGAVGRKLLMRFGIPWIVVDATGPLRGLFGYYFEGRAPKYFRGPVPVRLGDLAYTELMLFGP